EEDKYSRSRNEMLDAMAVAMGGRVAEEIALDDVTGGASQDIAQATDIAHAMVCRFGMSEKLGPVRYGERSEHIYLGRDITRNEGYSEETAREIDMEIKRLVSSAKEHAARILTEQRERLDKLANALLEKETMDAVEIRSLLNLPQSDAQQEAHTETAPADGTPE
ncbi:MAG: cell division protein FtsH, partial [Lentisphaeria bacterium]|nr:cell division protein FtsH [Lentisphaeria bacterium]